jgi:two-component system, cell cycle sensor histidine kinase and response regulator CckA
MDANNNLSRKQLHEQLVDSQKRIAELEKSKEEFKKIKETLLRSEENYRILTEGLKDVVLRVSVAGFLDYCSPAVYEFGGYEVDEEAGQSISKYFARRVEFSRALQRLKNAALKKETTAFEFLFMPKNRHPFPVEITSKPLIKDGKVLAFQCVMRDISLRREAEREKQRLEEKLVQFEKMEAIGRLAGGIAHDLNNVLSAVVGYPDLLLTKLPMDDPIRKPILTIKRSGQKAAAIVEDLLTLARRGVRTRKVVNLNDIVKDYLKKQDYEKLCHYFPKIRIETSLELELFNIYGSPSHLLKALHNLVTNAAESMPEGGHITISTLNLYPDKTSDDLKLEDYVVLMVSDNGLGFGVEDREKMFEPFYTRKILGKSSTGLGMAVVWGTVQDHDGYINFESHKGKGSTFELYFPVSNASELTPEEDSPLPIERYLGHGQKILVVDDGEEQREVTTTLLEKLGYKIKTVDSGEEAVRLCRRGQGYFDLIILDMIMGDGMDGLDTFKQIKKICQDTKVLIVSGFSETDRVKEAQRLGAGEYIKKPCTIEQLGRAIKKVLKNN